jgi:hypothetical protein
MAAKSGYTMVHIKLDTHSKLKEYCKQNNQFMGVVIEKALTAYLSNNIYTSDSKTDIEKLINKILDERLAN